MNTELVQFIHETICARGPQPFAWFMQQALYHPQHGYYASGRAAIGRHGDYFTNVSVSPLFGQLLTIQFAEIWEHLGNINKFTIVEQGAHEGAFARDVLRCARECFPKFFAALRYRIIEPFPALQDRQSQTLAAFRDKVEWAKTLTPFVGVHFSNELLDALPINLRGKRVGLAGDEFVFVQCADELETKPNQAALDWVDNVTANLERGVVIAVDYGFTRSVFHESLQVRAQHRRLASPFEQIGRADITMHVNWTDIAERLKAKGLHIAGFTDQHHFLTGILSADAEILHASCQLADGKKSVNDLLDLTALSRQVRRERDEKISRALQTLLHPEMLGRAFQVLALSKDVDVVGRLCGFKFARDARVELEL
ncbi:MAG TPA: SAM-dependent methyltransferase [Chthoniobacterales bacterium]|nr:SAM-dependent methyltransferase [Chthoniobacterales bacterium]